jgi:hypothetical protein
MIASALVTEPRLACQSREVSEFTFCRSEADSCDAGGLAFKRTSLLFAWNGDSLQEEHVGRDQQHPSPLPQGGKFLPDLYSVRVSGR